MDYSLAREFVGHSSGVSCVSVGFDDMSIFSGSWDKFIIMWSLCDGSIVRKFDGHSSSVYCLAVFSDGKQIVSGSRDLLIHNIASGQIVGRLNGH